MTDYSMEYEEEGGVSGTVPFFGAIFMSNIATKRECFKRNLLGLPAGQADFVKHVKEGMILFLFEFEKRELFGVFRAISDGELNIVPSAFRASGKRFPAQVRFAPIWHCSPLREHEFRGAIVDNYYSAKKFHFGLSEDQVRRLLFLFVTKKMKKRLPERALKGEVERSLKKHGRCVTVKSMNGSLQSENEMEISHRSDTMCDSHGVKTLDADLYSRRSYEGDKDNAGSARGTQVHCHARFPGSIGGTGIHSNARFAREKGRVDGNSHRQVTGSEYNDTSVVGLRKVESDGPFLNSILVKNEKEMYEHLGYSTSSKHHEESASRRSIEDGYDSPMSRNSGLRGQLLPDDRGKSLVQRVSDSRRLFVKGELQNELLRSDPSSSTVNPSSASGRLIGGTNNCGFCLNDSMENECDMVNKYPAGKARRVSDVETRAQLPVVERNDDYIYEPLSSTDYLRPSIDKIDTFNNSCVMESFSRSIMTSSSIDFGPLQSSLTCNGKPNSDSEYSMLYEKVGPDEPYVTEFGLQSSKVFRSSMLPISDEPYIPEFPYSSLHGTISYERKAPDAHNMRATSLGNGVSSKSVQNHHHFRISGENLSYPVKRELLPDQLGFSSDKYFDNQYKLSPCETGNPLIIDGYPENREFTIGAQESFKGTLFFEPGRSSKVETTEKNIAGALSSGFGPDMNSSVSCEYGDLLRLQSYYGHKLVEPINVEELSHVQPGAFSEAQNLPRCDEDLDDQELLNHSRGNVFDRLSLGSKIHAAAQQADIDAVNTVNDIKASVDDIMKFAVNQMKNKKLNVRYEAEDDKLTAALVVRENKQSKVKKKDDELTTTSTKKGIKQLKLQKRNALVMNQQHGDSELNPTFVDLESRQPKRKLEPIVDQNIEGIGGQVYQETRVVDFKRRSKAKKSTDGMCAGRSDYERPGDNALADDLASKSCAEIVRGESCKRRKLVRPVLVKKEPLDECISADSVPTTVKSIPRESSVVDNSTVNQQDSFKSWETSDPSHLIESTTKENGTIVSPNAKREHFDEGTDFDSLILQEVPHLENRNHQVAYNSCETTASLKLPESPAGREDKLVNPVSVVNEPLDENIHGCATNLRLLHENIPVKNGKDQQDAVKVCETVDNYPNAVEMPGSDEVSLNRVGSASHLNEMENMTSLVPHDVGKNGSERYQENGPGKASTRVPLKVNLKPGGWIEW